MEPGRNPPADRWSEQAAEAAKSTVARDGTPVAELRSLESLKLRN